MAKYRFNKDSFDFSRIRYRIWKTMWRLIRWFVASASIAIVYYIVAAFFVSTDEERQLRKENRMYKRLYSQLVEQKELIGDVVSALEARDDAIYEEIFHSKAPAATIETVYSLMSSTDSAAAGVVAISEDKFHSIEVSAAHVDSNIMEIFSLLANNDSVLPPPMASPVKDLSYARIGTSTGMKFSPFYKVQSSHHGLDIITRQGETVYAPASGIVSGVVRSSKGLGNVVEIDHGNGYVTRYAHMGSIAVSRGQSVKKGSRIGAVGMSGNSYVSHLHYEVLREGEYMDPVNYFFAELMPQDYMNYVFMSVTTEQSLD